MRRILFVGALVAMSGCAASVLQDPWRGPVSACAWQVCVYPTASGESLVFRARNEGPVIATVSLTFDLLQNLRLTDSVPVVRTVPPLTSVILTRLGRVDSLASINAHPLVRIDLGSDSTRHDPDVLYSMPFGGTQPRELVAGFGAPTHHGEDFYSLDFAMAEGTPVLAARAGVVVHVQDGFTEGGVRADLIENANLVAIAHADGTLASYRHLRLGIQVAVGDSVSAGQLLGFSGSSGSSAQPHLHFHVGKRLTAGEDRTIPVRFASPTGGILELIEGEWYPPAGSRAPAGSAAVTASHLTRGCYSG